jgi:hypothetical protein
VAFIDQTYVNNAITSAVRAKVAPTDDIFDQYEAQARAIVQAAAEIAGIALGDTTTSERVKFVTLGQWVILAYGLQKGLAIHPSIQTSINMLKAVEAGRLSLGDASTRDGTGGVKFSNTTTGSGRSAWAGGRKLRDDWF